MNGLAVIRCCGAVAAVLVALCAGGGAAGAVRPPGVDPAALGPALALAAQPRPPDVTEQRSLCAAPVQVGAPVAETLPQRVLDLPAAWRFSRGAGQKVAVIDTGVTRHPRLPAIQAGGDFVAGTDGTHDCDGHGTLVAGIVAARPSNADGFVGVAPDATILAIRQLSVAYEAKDRPGRDRPGQISSGYGTVLTLAAAIVRAVDLGATVINISELACAPAAASPVDGVLGAAVKFAYDRNVVVVAAAGNVNQHGACSTQNDGIGWRAVKTVASPAWFTPYVLSVGSVDPDGGPSEFSLAGPWVGVAAPGRDIISLDSRPGSSALVNGIPTDDGVVPVNGTSFAAPYVAGLAALVRAKFPNLTAGQVIDRIVGTAHHPGQGRDDRVGAGLVDPSAALTAVLDEPRLPDAAMSSRIAAPAPEDHPNPLPRHIAVIGTAVCAAGLVFGLVGMRTAVGRREDEQGGGHAD